MNTNRKKYLKNYFAVPANKVKHLLAAKKWRETNTPHIKLRMRCLEHYGNGSPSCKCCGEDEIKFLSLDHINGGGTAHRKGAAKGNVPWWIVKNNFPEGIFQILCHNCNMAKGFYGKCPHNSVLNPAKIEH